MTFVLRKINFKKNSNPVDVYFEYIFFNNDFAWLQRTGDNIRYFNSDESSGRFLTSLNSNDKNVFADIIINKKGKIIYNNKKNKLD